MCDFNVDLYFLFAIQISIELVSTSIESEYFPKGLNEDVVKLISNKKQEPSFMLDFRLRAYRQWQKMSSPLWSYVKYPQINYQDILFYSVPKVKEKLESLDEVDPELLDTFNAG